MYFNNIKHIDSQSERTFYSEIEPTELLPKEFNITMQFIYIHVHVLWIFERPLNYHQVHHEIRASGDDLQTFTLEFSFFFQICQG